MANIGDSRLFTCFGSARIVSKRSFLCVKSWLRMGKLKRGSRDYLEKKVITRAVGVSEDVDTDLFALKLKSGDQILMCSDGFKQAWWG